MNYLAHLWLADHAGADLAGSVLADWLRGPPSPALPPAMALSIRLHRRIDAVTDRHPVVAAARAHFPPATRRYAGIALDLAWDHLLAQAWPEHHEVPFDAFVGKAAHEVARHSDSFVAAGGPALDAERFAALLKSYASPAGLQRAAQRTAQRLRQPDGLLAAAAGLPDQLAALRPQLAVLLWDLAAAGREFMARAASDGAGLGQQLADPAVLVRP